MKRIAIDVDGVLANFVVGLLEVANEQLTTPIPLDKEPSAWNFADLMSPEEFSKAFKTARNRDWWWADLPPYGFNTRALGKFLVSSPHDTWLVTARSTAANQSTPKQTLAWAVDNNVSEGLMGIVAVEKAEEKAKLYDIMGITHSIDDKAETVEDCDQLANHKAYLLDRPWNQHAKVKRRIKTLQEFLDDLVDTN
jgi:hypothetical protein